MSYSAFQRSEPGRWSRRNLKPIMLPPLGPGTYGNPLVRRFKRIARKRLQETAKATKHVIKSHFIILRVAHSACDERTNVSREIPCNALHFIRWTTTCSHLYRSFNDFWKH